MNNQLTVVGRVGSVPRAVNFADTGNKVVKFSLGVKDYTSKSKTDETLWIEVDAWNGLGDRVMDYVTKGRELLLCGRLAINKYTTEIDGRAFEVHKPVLKLTSFHLCGAKPTDEEGAEPAEPAKKRSRKSA